MKYRMTRSMIVLLTAANVTLGCSSSTTTAPPDADEGFVTLSFTGTVTDVSTRGESSLPSHVSVGAALEASFYFWSGTAKSRDFGSFRAYEFPAGSYVGIVVKLGTTAWYVPLQRLSLRDDPNSGDALSVSGVATVRWLFPHMLEHGSISCNLLDVSAPYDMLTGVDLPASVSNLNFSTTDRSSCRIFSGGFGRGWSVTFTLDSMTGAE